MNEERKPKYKLGDVVTVYIGTPSMERTFTITYIKKEEHIPENDEDDGFHYEYGHIYEKVGNVAGNKWVVDEEDIVKYGKIINHE